MKYFGNGPENLLDHKMKRFTRKQNFKVEIIDEIGSFFPQNNCLF